MMQVIPQKVKARVTLVVEVEWEQDSIGLDFDGAAAARAFELVRTKAASGDWMECPDIHVWMAGDGGSPRV